jgi:hypothetical protein
VSPWRSRAPGPAHLTAVTELVCAVKENTQLRWTVFQMRTVPSRSGAC